MPEAGAAMSYQFQFQELLPYSGQFVRGVWLTVQLTAVSTVLGLALGTAGAAARRYGQRWLRTLVGTYVEIVRNTPFIVQLFFIFFGLPNLGVRLTAGEAAVIAMVVNLGAYSTEIIRAGLQAIPKGQVEAGQSLGMSGVQVFRYVIIRPALAKIWPALSSQCVIVMLGSSVVSQISAEELTFAANFIQSRNFRSFEVYAVTTLLYLALALGLRQVFGLLGRQLFARR